MIDDFIKTEKVLIEEQLEKIDEPEKNYELFTTYYELRGALKELNFIEETLKERADEY